jgi:hypothetical protein
MKKNVIEKLAALITAAFGLVAALAWNDAIRSLFKGPCTIEDAGALCAFSSAGPWAYAVFVTIIAVIATMWIARVAEKASKPVVLRKLTTKKAKLNANAKSNTKVKVNIKSKVKANARAKEKAKK